MRYIKILVLTFLLIVTLAFSAQAEMFRAGFNVDYYSVKDSLFQDIYGSGNLMFGASLSFNLVWKIELRAEANYLQSTGHMTASQEELKFTLMPFVIGARVKVLEKKLSPYVGFGVNICSYKEDYPERFEGVSESVTGFHFEIGSYFNLPRNFYADINIRYIKLDAEPYDEVIELGGLRAGFGIGYRF